MKHFAGITFVPFNRYLQNPNQQETEETAEQMYCPGKSSRGPRITTTSDSRKQLACLLQEIASGSLPTGGLLLVGAFAVTIMFIPEAVTAASV